MSFLKNTARLVLVIVAMLMAVFFWQVYVPASFGAQKTQTYQIQKGSGFADIARDLGERGIIRQPIFFEAYVLATRSYNRLQAGDYEISSGMSIAAIAHKFSAGQVIKNTITIIEGWDLEDIALSLAAKKVYSRETFLAAAKKGGGLEFGFLADAPKTASLEGYLFPDTYEILPNENVSVFLKSALANFDKKLTPDLRQEISRQQKSLFKIITMASIIEKEVQSPEDKKIVAGILWKRLANGMPLQADSTVNYVTGKHDGAVAIKDTKIDSPYNTYKYYGLPPGPICNPGIDSILAAVYPIKTDYWYYLSATNTGKTIYSKTLEEHQLAVKKYLTNP